MPALRFFYDKSPLRSSVCTNASAFDPFMLVESVAGVSLLDQYRELVTELQTFVCKMVRDKPKAPTFGYAIDWSMKRLSVLLLRRGQGDEAETELARVSSSTNCNLHSHHTHHEKRRETDVK